MFVKCATHLMLQNMMHKNVKKIMLESKVYDGQIFDWDFNIAEYVENNKPQFAVYDNADVLQMIQTLTRGLKIPLKAWFD